MITYQPGTCILFRYHGSVFPKSLLVALPCAVLAGAFKYFEVDGLERLYSKEDPLLRDPEVYSGFAFLVGFLIVFRTNQAYNRYWGGVMSTVAMQAEWFDSASSLVAFCKAAKCDASKVDEFMHKVARLFSLLDGAALCQLRGEPFLSCRDIEVLDAKGLDREGLRTIAAQPEDRIVELIFQFIQQLMVESIGTGVLTIPAPICSRAFQEFATGMVNFREALMITNVPFPFPFAQVAEILLIFHWVLTPFVLPLWTEQWYFTSTFTFIQVFILWSLNFIAKEIEDPFGDDYNDLELCEFQKEFNEHLLLLLDPRTLDTPVLSPEALWDAEELEFTEHRSLSEIWSEMEENGTFERYSNAHGGKGPASEGAHAQHS
eukprot:gnl/TRDRNA2_/TRDRNA2_45912_c0_seq2.p1 gnl/TRDRNA2_/TRDRNA2_45912_c0~~gnl/TRDRNA2_/TRDRNA2_45912_c0_seq2.p1  ORF type:complete len:375 (+),score=67.64 gnl/TRDRNA2_/TRDRNA2_45912_c0_seq2:130-1254(+)